MNNSPKVIAKSRNGVYLRPAGTPDYCITYHYEHDCISRCKRIYDIQSRFSEDVALILVFFGYTVDEAIAMGYQPIN